MSSSSAPAAKPLPPVTVHFLGTCSGGGPIISRNCSSLAVDFGNDIWLFDAADGTLPRLHQSSLRLTNISRIFITHMHADHVLGLVAILTTIMSGIGTKPEDLEKLKAQGTAKKADINIYGTRGLRKLIRTTLELTSVTLAGAYAVHELLEPGEETGSVTCGAEDLHTNEAVGLDLNPDRDGVWPEVLAQGQGKGGKNWGVSAGPIEHRVPAIGYVLQESTPRLPLDTQRLIPLLQANADALAEADPPIRHPLSLLSHLTSLPSPPPYTLPDGEVLHAPEPSGIPPRKLVIFGDCSGGTKNPTFESMCKDASLLIHECTNAAIPELIQRGDKGRKVRMKGMDDGLVKRSEEQTGKPVGKETMSKDGEERKQREEEKRVEVRKKAAGRGHSTPDEVGEFARKINARRIVVNHFSAMFPAPRFASSEPSPSLLSPISPYPVPTPYPPPRLPDKAPDPLPLTASELHLRLIMQSLADQITRVWTGEDGASEEVSRGRAIPARDFMVVRVPGHELSDVEKQEVRRSAEESERITADWMNDGGVWVGEGDERSWIGVEDPPTG